MFPNASETGSGSSEADLGARENKNVKDVYDLLEDLCKINVSANNRRDILRNVTQYISNCPTALSTTLPYDETVLASKIVQHLRNSDAKNTDTLPFGSKESAVTSTPLSNGVTPTELTENKAELFLKLHEQLKSSQLDTHQRSALLTFLYYMADSKYKSRNFRIQENSQEKQNSGNHCYQSQNLRHNQQMAYSTQNVTFQNMHSQFLQRTQSVVMDPMTTKVSNPGSHVGSYNRTRLTSELARMSMHLNAGNIEQRPTYNQEVSYVNGTSTIVPRTIDLTETFQPPDDDIVQSIIYSFTGVNSKFLKKDITSNRFRFDIRAKSLNIIPASMLLRLSELGSFHQKVQMYTDTRGGYCALGLMGQGFISALKNELTRYYGMVALLQEQINKQRNNMRTFTPVRSSYQYEKVTLMKLLAWSVNPLQRMQWLATIGEACVEKKGGALASTLHGFLSNGSPTIKIMVTELLLSACNPLYKMLTRWLLEGEICDPHGEFFIECLGEVGPDRLWHDKYRVRTSMLPNFISTEMANKILVAGKSINFLSEVCEDKLPVKGRDELHNCIESNAEDIFSNDSDTRLHSTIDSIYLNTSKRVLDIVLGPHKLLEHLQAMRRYLLLGQGDFIGILMANLKFELDKPAKDLYSNDLSSIMDAAIRSTNAQYDDPEILNHLDVRLLSPCDGDIGWDILSLQYSVSGPLATMLEPSMGVYQVLFKPLWRMKHMEFVLSSKIWKDQMCNAKALRSLEARLSPIFYRLYLFTSEMIHFIHQVQYYILFEVIECAWSELQQKVQEAKVLDEILKAHDNFLNNIKMGCFLDANSSDLSQSMENVYESITNLEIWQDKFYEVCFKELEARKLFSKSIEISETKGEFGITGEKQLQRDHEKMIFEQQLVSYLKSLENIGSNYEKAVRCFLLTLNSNNDANLQLFGIRLDFNEYYKKRDQRLGVPLTFEHMRMSNIFFNSSKGLIHGSRSSTIMNN